MDRSYRKRFVERLNLLGSIVSPDIERALMEVPLHRLIDTVFIRDDGSYCRLPEYEGATFGPVELELIYSGAPLVLSLNNGLPYQTTLPAPVLVQVMESLELKRGMNVLEIGSGDGYLAALLAEIVGTPSVSIVSNRRQTIGRTKELLTEAGYPDIATIATRDLNEHHRRAPFDRIVVSVGCSDLSHHWLKQLNSTGFLIVPLDHGGWFPLIRVWRRGEVVHGRVIGSAGVTIDREDELAGAPGIWWIKELNQEVQELPRWNEISPTSLRDFWFFVSIQNPHTGVFKLVEQSRTIARGFGIDDPQFGWSMIVSGSGGLLGRPQALKVLDRYYGDWRIAGSPRMADYAIEFLPKGSLLASHHPLAWTLERRYFLQRTRLTKKQ